MTYQLPTEEKSAVLGNGELLVKEPKALSWLLEESFPSELPSQTHPQWTVTEEG